VEPPAVPAHGAAAALVDRALSLRGTRYRMGGETPQDGFDCSGYVQYVFAQVHVDLPRSVSEQFHAGTNAPLAELRAGDLLFFTTTAPGATHVAIAIGHEQFVHAPSSTGVVRVESLTTSYWSSRLVGARHVLP
jgi:cell wall-associated NlpC family hydrolase